MGLLDGLKQKMTEGVGSLMAKNPELMKKMMEKMGGLDQTLIEDMKNLFQDPNFQELILEIKTKGASVRLTLDQIKKAVGDERLERLATQFKTTKDALAQQLADTFPKMVEKMSQGSKNPQDMMKAAMELFK